MTLITKSGWESMGTWLLATSCVVALIRFATKRCNSGCTVRSLVATIYELGFDLQATPSSFCVNRSAAGAKCSCPDELLLLLRQVAREALDTVRQHPETPVRDFDVGESVGDGEFRLLALRCLVRVRG